MAVANRDGDIVYAAQHKRADDEAARIACGYVVGDGDAISATRGDSVGTPDLYYDFDFFIAHRRSPPRRIALSPRWVIARSDPLEQRRLLPHPRLAGRAAGGMARPLPRVPLLD
ncbi:MAG: hypothetical protein JWP15_3220 [Alphaproteobacteria bacterium]|nr:hypothetical protein [Alphaproteobacteria bacterium]